MKTIKVPEIKDLDKKSTELLGNIQSALGMIPNIYAVIGYSSETLERYLAFSTGAGKESFTPKEVEAIKLAVSEANKCKYCASAHTALARNHGFSEQDTLDFRSANPDHPRLKVLTRLAREIAKTAGNVDSEFKADFFALGYKEKDLVNLVAVVLSVTFTNYIFGLTQVEIDFPKARDAA
jgi:AhpD family alkylhydroperoxidase